MVQFIRLKGILKSTYLKDPVSYDGIDWGPVILVNSSNFSYKVSHKFRAKNSFGGYVIETKTFFLDDEGNVVYVE